MTNQTHQSTQQPQQRTFHLHVWAGLDQDRKANEFLISVYRYYRLIHAETKDTLKEARAAARMIEEEHGDGNVAVHITDEHGTQYSDHA